MTYLELIHQTQRRFGESKVECAEVATHTVDFLLQVTGFRREKLFLMHDDPVEGDRFSEIEIAVKRRLAGEPLQYIVENAWFWNSKFKVGPGVLIPRKETEHLVEFLLTLSGSSAYRVGELGAGSGNIGISALQERPNWEWFGFEANGNSIPYLEYNVRELLADPSSFKIFEGDFFSLSKQVAPFDILVSNPPYLAENEKVTLSREVQHEPDLALYGGVSGVECIERLLRASANLLVPGGVLIFEIGSDQGMIVKEMAVHTGLKKVRVLKDLAGFDRILVAEKL